MTNAGKTIFYFGFWVLVCGLSLFFLPTMMLAIAGIEVTDTIVPRLFGMVLVFLSIYYFFTGRRPEFAPFFRVTVYTRASAFLIVAALVVLGLAKPIILGFVAVDLAGAIWTWSGLKKDAAQV